MLCNQRLTGMGIPVSCEVDIYGAVSEFIGTSSKSGCSKHFLTLTIQFHRIFMMKIFTGKTPIHIEGLHLWASIVGNTPAGKPFIL